jgi:hypothetical protein
MLKTVNFEEETLKVIEDISKDLKIREADERKEQEL